MKNIHSKNTGRLGIHLSLKMSKQTPNIRNIELWNRLVKEVFNHPKSEYSLFVYEMIKRRVLGRYKNEYRASIKSDKDFGIDNIS